MTVEDGTLTLRQHVLRASQLDGPSEHTPGNTKIATAVSLLLLMFVVGFVTKGDDGKATLTIATFFIPYTVSTVILVVGIIQRINYRRYRARTAHAHRLYVDLAVDNMINSAEAVAVTPLDDNNPAETFRERLRHLGEIEDQVSAVGNPYQVDKIRGLYRDFIRSNRKYRNLA